FRVPDPQRPIKTTRGDARAVRAPRHARDLERMAFEGEGLLALVQVPNPQRPLEARRGDARAVRAPRHAPDLERMASQPEGPPPSCPAPTASERAALPACFGIPEPQRPVNAAEGDARAVRAPRQVGDGARAPLETVELPARFRIPEPQRPVKGRRGDARAVRA